MIGIGKSFILALIMITRFRVDGFKNLSNLDIRFSEFTCIAGPNGAGKSNLFDAIHFLSLTATHGLHEAALAIRSEGSKSEGVSSIFRQVGNTQLREIDFHVEMIVPKTALDALNQRAIAAFTFLVYELKIGLRDSPANGAGPIEILEEQLTYIPWGKAHENLFFDHNTKWRNTLKQEKTGGNREYFISTAVKEGQLVIQRHQDGGSSGRPLPALASQLPRTVLSQANASESPTALCAKQEMMSWRFLFLEASSMRLPDGFNDNSSIDVHGKHIPATLNRLIKTTPSKEAILAKISNRLMELVGNIDSIEVVEDSVRETYSIVVTDKSGMRIPARSLSDGTLRFLALAVMEQDAQATGVICMEEPENGIHPKRIPAMVRLLRDIALDPQEPCDESNPLRQVIINTHSPSVVSEVPEDSLVIVYDQNVFYEERVTSQPTFAGLPNTWREKKAKTAVISKGILLPYLNPVVPYLNSRSERKRVADREDLQMLLPMVNE